MHISDTMSTPPGTCMGAQVRYASFTATQNLAAEKNTQTGIRMMHSATDLFIAISP